MMNKWIKKIGLIFCIGLLSTQVLAQGVSLNKTRIIYSHNSKGDVVSVINDDDVPYLVQAGVTTDLTLNPSKDFIITPPIFRLEANSTSSLRILLKRNDNLPLDRESLFYLNVKLIPSTKKRHENENASALTIVTSFIIKIIYRPESISMPTNHEYRQVLLKNKNDKWFFDNPTPYYLTVSNLEFNRVKERRSMMLPPYSQMEIEHHKNIKQATWNMINDYGELSSSFSNKAADK